MTKMKTLIKGMCEEGINIAVFADWYSQYETNCEKCANLAHSGQTYIFSDAYKSLDRLYENMIGFLWGLTTLNYITEETRSICIHELINMQNF